MLVSAVQIAVVETRPAQSTATTNACGAQHSTAQHSSKAHWAGKSKPEEQRSTPDGEHNTTRLHACSATLSKPPLLPHLTKEGDGSTGACVWACNINSMHTSQLITSISTSPVTASIHTWQHNIDINNTLSISIPPVTASMQSSQYNIDINKHYQYQYHQ
jgi:hypothetical protein